MFNGAACIVAYTPIDTLCVSFGVVVNAAPRCQSRVTKERGERKWSKFGVERSSVLVELDLAEPTPNSAALGMRGAAVLFSPIFIEHMFSASQRSTCALVEARSVQIQK